MNGARSITAIIFSMECNCDSLGRLPDVHRVDEKLQRSKIPILDELDGGLGS